MTGSIVVRPHDRRLKKESSVAVLSSHLLPWNEVEEGKGLIEHNTMVLLSDKAHNITASGSPSRARLAPKSRPAPRHSDVWIPSNNQQDGNDSYLRLLLSRKPPRDNPKTSTTSFLEVGNIINTVDRKLPIPPIDIVWSFKRPNRYFQGCLPRT